MKGRVVSVTKVKVTSVGCVNEMPAILGFMVEAIGIMGSQSLLHLGALSVPLNKGLSFHCC